MAEAPSRMAMTEAKEPAGGDGKPRGPAAAMTQRKIIRTADLAIEADDPTAAQRRASELVDKLGGYVVTSDVLRGPSDEAEDAWLSVSMTARVPSSRFVEALEALRALGVRVTREKVGGQDVTEEYMDLQARLKTQRALEAR